MWLHDAQGKRRYLTADERRAFIEMEAKDGVPGGGATPLSLGPSGARMPGIATRQCAARNCGRLGLAPRKCQAAPVVPVTDSGKARFSCVGMTGDPAAAAHPAFRPGGG